MQIDQPHDLDWRDGVPVSRRFDDPFYSLEDGLAEAQHVFLGGNGLPARFRDRFHIAELGFGTGLNFVASALAWREAGHRGRLHFTSFEAFPLAPEDMRAALAAFPEAAPFARMIETALDGRAGRHDLGITLSVVVGRCAADVPAWQGRADAWFLDGFAPPRNPELVGRWPDARRGRAHRAGGTCATYSAAGCGAARAGRRRVRGRASPGFGRKRHMTAGPFSMSRDNPRLGIFLMIATTFVFAMQDGISRYLAGEYNVLMVVMIRYWFFAAFVIALAARSRGGIARAARTEQPWLQAGAGFFWHWKSA
jgi:tRNA U34 5-methylaminomethyl-2-thiouridine-forming methyltransferase MnmC